MQQAERTFILIKPDGVQRKLVGKIIQRFEERGFKLVALKFTQPDQQTLQKHYEDLVFKPFFPCLISYMLSGPVVAMIWEGKDAVKQGRLILGETNPLLSKPGTIRGDFAIDIGRNVVHGSDSVDAAQKEINLWFAEPERVQWKTEDSSQIYE
ncbi:nucleoside diphosphate kinase [Paramecium bursaria]